ncbi:peroxiredoxin [Jannaschia sp. LMIT008]|uniref:peroxiredoxin n=1 Tax=Jannaschia maritima TaxID=3032585 RepID=UPI002810C04A|nr:peroxiredoxin [Jannaschia sp. LMIT008]
MTIAQGDRLPEASLIRMGDGGPEPVTLSSVTAGKTVALFGVPGAFTGTCSNAHMPSFVNNADALKAKGVDAIVCVAVNDPFVMQAWAKDTGADGAGIHMLADADGAFTKAMGLDFDAPPVGFHGRSRRFSALVEDGTVKTLSVEESPGVCDVSSGDAMLKAL